MDFFRTVCLSIISKFVIFYGLANWWVICILYSYLFKIHMYLYSAFHFLKLKLKLDLIICIHMIYVHHSDVVINNKIKIMFSLRSVGILHSYQLTYANFNVLCFCGCLCRCFICISLFVFEC